VTYSPLAECVARTRSIASLIASQQFDAAMAMRGGSFTDSYRLLRTIVQALPRSLEPGQRALRLAVLHGGDPAPGMNAAVRVALRVAMDRGHVVLAVADGFRGLIAGRIEPLDWMSVSGWVSRPGAELGTNRFVPEADDMRGIAAQLDAHGVDGLLVIGGWAGYLGAHRLSECLAIPIVCVPASINNDVPASDLSVGADTALNSIVTDVDKIKQSAVASHRCFVVEVMGEDCGFLALMGGMATGAERVYLPEEGITLERLSRDLDALRAGFARGKRLGLVVRREGADALYTTSFIVSLFNHESNGLFDVRGAILGHVQDGGQPSPFDRIQAARLTAAAVDHLIAKAGSDDRASAIVGMREGKIVLTPLGDLPELVDGTVHRSHAPGWWMALRPLADIMASVTP
jgi:6-phosphofructokinase 1